MAAIRPVILVFQEFASPTITPTTPDLNCLIVGPAYFIQDYFQPGTTNYADKANIGLNADYGQLEGPIGTATPVGSDVIVQAEPPNAGDAASVGAILDEASVVVYADQARVIITSGTTGTTSASTPNQFSVADAVDFTTGATKVLPGDRVILKDGGNNKLVRTVYTVDSATQLHFTQDLPSVGFTPGTNQGWRIERQLNDQVVSSSFYTVNGNALHVNGGITLAVAGQGAKTVSYAKMYMAYRELRQNIADVDTVASEDEILAKIGRLDARNPLAVGAFVALQNTTSTVQFIGVLTDDLAGHTDVRDRIAAHPDVYAVVPLNADPSIIAMWNSDCVGLALPDEVHGRPQRFRAVIGSGTLPITKAIVSAQSTGTAQQLVGSGPTGITKFTLPGLDMVTANVVPGDKLHITLDVAGVSRDGTYTIANVVSATVVELDPSTPIPSAETGNCSAEIRAANDTTVIIAVTPVTAAISAAHEDLYLVLQDAAAGFITAGVAAGDVVEMPADPNSSSFTGTLTKFVVNSVLSENRLQIVNNGADTATVENELPHGLKRDGSALVTQGSLNYQVVRTLTKDEQVTDLIAFAQSFKSRRTVLVWPDTCDVAGVVGGTKQPGYYMACAVGGMTAGLPPHQGFTFLGIAGVSQIYNANTYFNDSQLTDLSNGGWYVFAQQTPTALPFSMHQLTTDPSTLESGEFSVVKNFDFVSLFFVDILQEFLGIYNVTDDTLVLIRAALNIGGETLRLRTYAKIGAPLTDFSILDLGVSTTSADRVVTHLSVGLPKPLNNVELHLVA